MLELAEHIIKKKRGNFDPSKVEDRYEDALAELVKAKAEGKKIEVRKKPQRGKVIDLMEALRQSASTKKKSAPPKKSTTSKPSKARTEQQSPRRKAS